MGNGPPIDLAAPSRSMREDDRRPPATGHRWQAEPPELTVARERYAETLAALEAARASYQQAKAQHAASKAALIALRARAATVSRSTDVG